MKVEIELTDAHARKLRELESLQEQVKNVAAQCRNLDNDLSNRRYVLKELQEKLTKAESDMAQTFMLAVMPTLNAPQAAAEDRTT